MFAFRVNVVPYCCNREMLPKKSTSFSLRAKLFHLWFKLASSMLTIGECSHLLACKDFGAAQYTSLNQFHLITATTHFSLTICGCLVCLTTTRWYAYWSLGLCNLGPMQNGKDQFNSAKWTFIWVQRASQA